MSSPNDASSSSNTDSDGELLFTPDFNISSSIQPYRFQPVRDSESSSSSGNDSDVNVPADVSDDNGRTQDASSWCVCGRCRTFPKVEECQCCQESQNVKKKLVCDEVDSENYMCITENPRFRWLVTDRESLHVAGLTMSLAYGTRLPEPLTDEFFRLVAYRQFTLWIHGRLGKKKRIPIPACVTARIRDDFPNIEPGKDDYTGFMDAH
ncbi:hypothetical protein ScPMuIL_017055 [Solemya velum]